MADFTMLSPKWEGEVKFSYYENGFIRSAEFPEVIDRKAAEFFSTHFPVHESQIEFFRTSNTVKITRIAADLTFEAFWDAYGRKAGSKEQARQYWDGEKRTLNKRPITETDRADIMGMVKMYSFRYQGAKKEFQPLATSFLHGRVWEAELENSPRKHEVNLLSLFTKQGQ